MFGTASKQFGIVVDGMESPNEYRRPGEGGDPVSYVLKSLDSRLRGNDGKLREKK
jgi:hypothetical protein